MLSEVIWEKQPGKFNYKGSTIYSNNYSIMCLHKYIIIHTDENKPAPRGEGVQLKNPVSSIDVTCVRLQMYYGELTFASLSPSSRFTTLSCVESAWKSMDTKMELETVVSSHKSCSTVSELELFQRWSLIRCHQGDGVHSSKTMRQATFCMCYNKMAPE